MFVMKKTDRWPYSESIHGVSWSWSTAKAIFSAKVLLLAYQCLIVLSRAAQLTSLSLKDHPAVVFL